MRLLTRFKRELALGSLVLFTLLALAIIAVPARGPETPKASLSDVLGKSNRTAPRAVNAKGITDVQITAYQDKLRTNPNDSATQGLLGLAYLQKARENGDPTYYNRAEAVFKKALELNPQNSEAMGGLGSLALSRHEFTQALAWGKKAAELRPDLAYNYGVITDAMIELGRYEEAVQLAQKMVDLRPDVSSYARVSYLRELYGQYDGAIEAMKQAAMAGGPTLENRSWIYYQLGNLYFNKNDLDQAEGAYAQALAMLPDYAYAQAGMSRLKAARGDLEGAIALYSPVVQRMPLPEFAIELGDMYMAAGKPNEANRQYELVRAIQKINRENGVNTDLEMALFDADHNLDLPGALSRAKEQAQSRPSLKAKDVLAWTLYKSGDYVAAQAAIKEALRFNTQDSLMFYHAGMIYARAAQPAEARTWLEKAFTLNPNFSFLHAAEARKTLAELGGSVALK